MKRLVPPITEEENIEYVIYARKSTEDDEKQKESIPQQLDTCFSFARNNNLVLKARPRKLPPEEHIVTQIKEAFENNPDKALDIQTQYIEKYVVAEVKSAKTPKARKHWADIVDKVRIGEIRAVLGYSPDRLARNLQEGGEFIQLIDEKLVRPKFTSFAFEDNASGHMMLGIFFVFAEHYSKKLSEDSNRGTKQKSLEGRALGVRKKGYDFNPETDFFVPHQNNFEIMRKVFERKIYDNWTDVDIANEVIENPKWTDKKDYSGKDISIGNLWGDHFYYGVWTRSFKDGTELRIDLREIPNYNFQPIISEKEFYLLQESLVDSSRITRKKWKTRIDKDLDEIKPLSKGVVVNEKGMALNPTLPNPKRFKEKLKEGQKEDASLKLDQIVEHHQIKFRVAKTKDGQSNSVDFEALDSFILHYLKQIKLSKRKKQAYLYAIFQKLENKERAQATQDKRINLVKNKIKGDRSKFYEETGYGAGLAGTAKKDWEKKEQGFEARLAKLNAEETEIQREVRNEIFEQQALVELMFNLPALWRKANYVQKRKICDILVLNIHIKDEKPHKIVLNADFEDCFSGLVAGSGFEPLTFGL